MVGKSKTCDEGSDLLTRLYRVISTLIIATWL